jgi:glycosyltransferase involved in cell wall biosynthesis
VAGLTLAGVKVHVFAGSSAREIPGRSRINHTLSLGKFRIPTRLIGRWASCLWHDHLTANWLEKHATEYDVLHCWPLGSLSTLRVAREYGLISFLERPNAHTSFAYECVAHENRALGLTPPPRHDHSHNQQYLDREEAEYRAADYLLCPSDFVRKTFLDRGYPTERLKRHHYGYSPTTFHPGSQNGMTRKGLVAIYAGVGEPRKGLHRALEAWHASGANLHGRFMICGEILPDYRRKISHLLEHPSVHMLGQRKDLADLMRQSDIMILSSIEEGSALVTYEARASGCVLLVSDAVGAVCEHMVNSMVHPSGDGVMLTEHIKSIDQDRVLLARLRTASIDDIEKLTWNEAGRTLKSIYGEAVETKCGDSRNIHPHQFSA